MEEGSGEEGERVRVCFGGAAGSGPRERRGPGGTLRLQARQETCTWHHTCGPPQQSAPRPASVQCSAAQRAP